MARKKNERGKKTETKMVWLDRVKEKIVWLRFPEARDFTNKWRKVCPE